MSLPEDYAWDMIMPTDGLPYRRIPDGRVFCIRCRKYADDSHLTSDNHKRWVEYVHGRQQAPQQPFQRQQLVQAALQQPLQDARPPPPGPPPGEPPGIQEGPPPPGFQEGLATTQDMEARLTRMEEKVLTMEAKLKDVEATSFRGMQDMEAKFTRMEEMVLTMEAKLKDMEAKLTTLNVINTWQEHTWVINEEGSNSWHWRGDGQQEHSSWQEEGGEGAQHSEAGGSGQPWGRE